MSEGAITRVLTMEDDAALSRLLQKRLERMGYAVETVSNGEEGLALLEKQPYDVILLDYHMPVVGGIEVIRRLAGRGTLPAIIMLTGEGNVEVAVEALKLGAADFIAKDTQMRYLELLPSVIEKVVSKQQLVCEREQIYHAFIESEARYRRMFESNPHPMWVYDQETLKFLAVNDAAIKHYGFSLDEFLGMTIEDICPADDASRQPGDDGPVASGPDCTGLRRLRKKDGTIIDVEIISHALNFGGRQADVVLANDVTERIKMEEERLRTQKLESLGILAGGLAHDFNNLLTSIMGNISLAQLDTQEGGPVYKRLDEAEKASLRARDLTQQLLTFSKGGQPVKQTVLLGESVRESAGFALRGSRSRCEFIIPTDLRPVEADEGQISQVINNLVINAVQAMPEGGLITVTCGNVTIGRTGSLPLPPGDYVRVSVADRGIGISKEYFEKIFDPYFTTKQKGSGLGLATSYSIIKRHGGHIAVESELGKGACFHVYLPVSGKDVPKKAGEFGAGVRGTGRVLVMDDEDMIRVIASQMLVKLGYTVDVAADGAEAIARYTKARQAGKPFDLVIMDLTIPGGLGGKDTIRMLRELYPEVKAIVSSGYSNDPVMAEFEKHGFCGVVGKPYTIRTLSEAVAQAIPSK
jgi:PAS domain S-box-containing protein